MIPMIIKRCLVHSIKIYPYELDTVLNQYEKKKIPDEIVARMSPRDLEDYVRGLYLSGCEMANDWTAGHNMLKKLGFSEKRIEDGHRILVSLVYD